MLGRTYLIEVEVAGGLAACETDGNMMSGAGLGHQSPKTTCGKQKLMVILEGNSRGCATAFAWSALETSRIRLLAIYKYSRREQQGNTVGETRSKE